MTTDSGPADAARDVEAFAEPDPSEGSAFNRLFYQELLRLDEWRSMRQL